MGGTEWRSGVPDWEDPTAYPETDDLDSQLWRWQFLRRREDYREDWLYWAPRTHDSQFFRCQKIGPEHLEFQARMPGAFDKYSLFALLNPANPCPFYLRFLPTFGYIETGRGLSYYRGGKLTELDLPEGTVAVTFDLTQPLKPQLARVKRALVELQERRAGRRVERRRHPEKWPLYLRVLDARDAGATWETIASKILVHERKEAAAARQIWEQAHQLMFNWPI